MIHIATIMIPSIIFREKLGHTIRKTHYSTFSFCLPHSLHLLHSASLLDVFNDFVSTICSSIVITEAVFLGLKFCLSHKLQLSSCFRNIVLCIHFPRYYSPRFFSAFFFVLAFIALLVGSQSSSILYPSFKMQYS